MGRLRSAHSSQLAILTPNQRANIIRKERERRRLIRFEQVRQLSAENAAKIRERVKEAKRKEMEEVRKRITDAIIQRNHLTPAVLSPPIQPAAETPLRRPRRRQITQAEIQRASRRHREALERLRREKERERRRLEIMLERRRRAEEQANLRSRRM